MPGRMNPTAAIVPLLRAVLIVCAWLIGFWILTPWFGLGGLALLGASSFAEQLAPERRRATVAKGGLATAWLASLVFVGSLLFGGDKPRVLDGVYALVAWSVAAAVLLTPIRDIGLRKRWRWLGMTWALVGGGIWLAASYLQDQRSDFYAGLLIAVGLMILCKTLHQMPGWGVMIANTVILLCIGLPFADFFVRPNYQLALRPGSGKHLYSYEAAKRDPEAFAAWWRYYQQQWNQMGHEVFTPVHPAGFPVALRSNSQGWLFKSRIHINSRGFRGPEIPVPKGYAYRIVALGESTTFGCTLAPKDEPWPALLEQIIGKRLKPDRPVQVINAGVPALDLRQNVMRLAKEILPLRPDLIISYHGYNGFGMIFNDLPPIYGRAQPYYWPRPLKLLANVEYRLKMTFYKRSLERNLSPREHTIYAPMKSRYASAYRRLIAFAHTNHIRLALANFSMAVNDRSDTDVVGFYGMVFAMVHRYIEANLAHTKMVKRLVTEHPEVCFVNTHPGLDGHHNLFIDLVHLTQKGRQQLAENIFAGIKPILEQDLAKQ